MKFYIITCFLFKQPIFYFAKMLIHPALNRMGINHNRLDIYNNLWDLTANVTRNGGFASGLYTTWYLRKLLQGRTNINTFNNVIGRYVNLADNNKLKTLSRLTLSSYGDVLPFIRQVNYMIATLIGNIGLLFVRKFLKTILLAGLTSIFTALTATIGILSIFSLNDLISFLNFAVRIKAFVDYLLSFLPDNLTVPFPEWLKNRIKMDLWNKDISLFILPFLKYILLIIGSQLYDWISFDWLFNALNFLLPFDINIFSILFRPLKAFLFYNGWYYLQKFLVCGKNDKIEYEFYGFIKKDIELFKFTQRIFKYLFDEFNLFD